MTIKTTTWSPDTCGCEIEYDWDTEVPQASRTHTLKQINKRCPAHSAGTLADEYAAVVDENTRKNILRGRMLEDFPALAIVDGDGNKDFIAGVSFNWEFDDQRVLVVTLPNVPPPVLANIQSLADSTFGAGKVIIQGV